MVWERQNDYKRNILVKEFQVEPSETGLKDFLQGD